MMKTDFANPDSRQTRLDRLHALLQQQVDLLRSSRYRELEALTEQTGALIAEIAQNPEPLTPQSHEQTDRIAGLYKQLELMIETEKETVTIQLRKVAGGKKTLRAYQHNP